MARDKNSRRFPTLPAAAVLALVYFVAGKLALKLAFLHASASPVWPPTGIALAALLLLGYRVWPAIFVGAFLVNVTSAGTVLTSLGIATGNTLEAVAACYLVSRFTHGCKAFDRAHDIFRFALLATVVAPAISATAGVISLCLVGFANWSSFGEIWLTWWFGDGAGALVVAPLLILWRTNPRLPWKKQAVEFVVLLAGMFLVRQA